MAGPGGFPEYLGGAVSPPEVSSQTAKFDRAYPTGLAGYAVVQSAILVVVTMLLGLSSAEMTWPAQLAWVAFVVWGLVDLGGLFEVRSWSFYLEAARVASAILLPFLLMSGPAVGWSAPVFFLGAAAFVVRVLGLRALFLKRGEEDDATGVGEGIDAVSI